MSIRDRAKRRPADPSDENRTEESPFRRAAALVLLSLSGLMLLVILYLGWTLLRVREGWRPAPTRELILAAPTADQGVAPLGGAADPAAGVPPVGQLSGPPPAVSPTFEGFYYARGGERILGLPLGPPQRVNGREIQWFERARLEHWPEHAGTPYEVQLGRLGAEYTQGREFARQDYFVSTLGQRYFPETGHAAEGLFLAFWEQNGGLDTFGLPISEAFDEVLADGVAYRVQYFERSRLEYHPELAGTPSEVLLGRLGAALLGNEARPNTVQPVPTAVPMP
ncbi:MAG: hypothetical protein HGA45_20560 [Chloroflexales bacterium]|nr:hypothetical protein [Chloroflexales bacterium]